MFQSERVFSHRNTATGLVEWFFNAREGVFGPYNSKDVAKKTLEEFVQKCITAGDNGGRGMAHKQFPKTALKPKEPHLGGGMGHNARMYVYEDLVVFVFSERNAVTGSVEWFFSVPEEHTYGPYSSKEVANAMLADFVRRRGTEGDGADKKLARPFDDSPLTLQSIGRRETVQEYDPLRQRKGRDV